MKEIKELKFEELSVKQKLGMVYTACIPRDGSEMDFVLELVKNRSLGAVWVYAAFKDAEETIKKIKDAADYPILIMTDAETGLGDYKIGNQSSLAGTGREDYAYSFGKVTASLANKMGYNIVCSPIVDMSPGNPRSLGTDKETVSKLSIAQAKGMHDGGVLTCAKHYPGARLDTTVDTHLTEAMSYDTKEDLLSYALYPYLKLMKEGLLDGIMTGHKRLYHIAPDNPASLSKPVIDIIREQGFDGFLVTDALCMMAISANFDDVTSKGMAVSAGNDLILPEALGVEKSFNQLCEAYDKGLIKDEILDEAVKRVLKTQHKVMLLPNNSKPTEEEKQNVKNINKDCVYAITDEGVLPSISRDGKHFFALMVRNGTDINDEGSIDVPAVDTFSNDWLHPRRIQDKIYELFPNSTVRAIDEFPSPVPIYEFMRDSMEYEDVVFIAHTGNAAYIMPPEFTYRMRNMINALADKKRISAMAYFGNTKVLEALSHIPRYIIGCQSQECIDAGIEVLAGLYPPKGIINEKPNLK